MLIKVDLRRLHQTSVELSGSIAAAEVLPDFKDELVELASPLEFDLEAEMQGKEVFVHGRLQIALKCVCGRCLKTFAAEVVLDEFAALVPLEGEDALVQDGDFGDLTPLLREDIYLALPTNPVCKPECRGLARKASARDSRLRELGGDASSPWTTLDRLKL
jgi:uncharacterized protein